MDNKIISCKPMNDREYSLWEKVFMFHYGQKHYIFESKDKTTTRIVCGEMNECKEMADLVIKTIRGTK